MLRDAGVNGGVALGDLHLRSLKYRVGGLLAGLFRQQRRLSRLVSGLFLRQGCGGALGAAVFLIELLHAK